MSIFNTYQVFKIGEGSRKRHPLLKSRPSLEFLWRDFLKLFYGENSKLGSYNIEVRSMEWRAISANPSYEVSNNGDIRRVGSNKNHSVRTKGGYAVTDLYDQGNRTTARVHRLVAQEFIPNPDNKPEVNHIDGNRFNNHVSNLEWVTKQENCKHAWDNGLARPSYGMRGKSNPNAGRKGKPFRIVETGEEFNTLKECEEAIGGDNRHINDCLRGRQQTHRGYHFEYL